MTELAITGAIPTWTLSDRLRKAREHGRLQQVQLAAITGISERSIQNYEAGRTTPRRPQLIAWALATGVPLAWLEDQECAVRDSNPEPADVCFAPVHVLRASGFSPSSEALHDLATSA
jgi:transcriptional regulator with XRE-family HTH domain